MSGAGEKRERPMVQVATETTNSEGAPVKTWNDYTRIWAEVQSLRGGEEEQMKLTLSERARRFITPYRTDITTKMQIVWRGEDWNIWDIQTEPDKFDMHIVCRRVQ